VVDKDGFRANVAMVISDGRGKLFWAKRLGQQAWQFPQGGVSAGESAEQALFRELYEEVGLESSDKNNSAHQEMASLPYSSADAAQKIQTPVHRSKTEMVLSAAYRR